MIFDWIGIVIAILSVLCTLAAVVLARRAFIEADA
jgi:hypothetical protein